MVEIVEKNRLLGKMLGDQVIKQTDYRLLTHLLKYNVDNGLLIYNSLTGALLFLDDSESSITNNPNEFEKNIKEFLIRNWYLVPCDNDDNSLCDKANEMMLMLYDMDKHPPLVHYTIFTTTDCNARCFYCFENKRSKIHMSEKTAEDVAEFIIKSSKGLPITIRWFGGEPLYNSKVIDIICNSLSKANISYKSTMVSNGYLFSEDIINKSKDLWNLQSVKIALDGTEEIYNRYKAYIYSDGSAFVRVINNIKNLIEAEIKVTVRLNMDFHNVDDLYDLAEYLHDKFGGTELLDFDLHMLLENSTQVQIDRPESERHILINKYNDLNKYLATFVKPKDYDLASVRRWKQCMADDNSATTILPDGRLGKCDYYTDDGFWGSIYSDEINEKEIARFKKMIRPDGGNKCNSCPIRPICLMLKECCDNVNRCDVYDQQNKIIAMDNCILKTYEKYKKEKENEAQV